MSLGYVKSLSLVRNDSGYGSFFGNGYSHRLTLLQAAALIIWIQTIVHSHDPLLHLVAEDPQRVSTQLKSQQRPIANNKHID